MTEKNKSDFVWRVLMKRVLVIGNSDFDIDLFKTFVYGDSIKNYAVSEREVQIRKDEEFVKIEAVNKIINEYDESERSKIPYDNPKIFMVTFSSIEFALQIIGDNRLPQGLFVDDFKTIRTLEEVVQKYK